MEEGRVLITMVAVGRFILTSGKAAVSFKEVNTDGSLGPDRAYLHSKHMNPAIGGVYTIEADAADPKTVFTGTIVYVRQWPDEQKRLEWHVAARAFDAQLSAAKLARKEKERNLIMETLEPLRRVYKNTNYQTRTALEILVLTYLRTGRIEED